MFLGVHEEFFDVALMLCRVKKANTSVSRERRAISSLADRVLNLEVVRGDDTYGMTIRRN